MCPNFAQAGFIVGRAADADFAGNFRVAVVFASRFREFVSRQVCLKLNVSVCGSVAEQAIFACALPVERVDYGIRRFFVNHVHGKCRGNGRKLTVRALRGLFRAVPECVDDFYLAV